MLIFFAFASCEPQPTEPAGPSEDTEKTEDSEKAEGAEEPNETPYPDAPPPSFDYCYVMTLNRPDILHPTLWVDHHCGGVYVALPWNKGLECTLYFSDNVYVEDVVFLEELGSSLCQQYEPHKGAFQNYDGYEFYFDSIAKISITTDKPIFNRKAGEELSDLFNIVVNYHPIFSYPEGILQNPEGGTTIKSVQEWIDWSVLIHSNYTFIVDEEFEQQMGELQNEVTFTIKITTTGGKSATSSVTQRFYF